MCVAAGQKMRRQERKDRIQQFFKYLYGFCYGIGNLISAHPEFRPSYYKGVNIIKVWIALKKLHLLIIGLLCLN